MGWSYLGILLIVSAVLCAIGFYKYVYFLSIGYGFSVGGIGIAIAVMSLAGVLPASEAMLGAQNGVQFGAQIGTQGKLQLYLLCVLLLLYGIRLSGFLLVREYKNAAYRKTLKEASGDESKMPLFVKCAIWVCVSILYVGQTCPVFYRLYQGQSATVSGWIGIVICIGAILLESAADKQKTTQKQKRPDMVAMNGLYRMVRCPNYLGEILFWTGIFVSGWQVLSGVGQWIFAILAYICIVYVMFNGAQRLEKRQMKRYGDNQEYNNYANHTPILIPLVPLYHLNHRKEV